MIGAGLDTADDLTPPTPAQMDWASPPTTVSDTVISMTAVTAGDENGVEYQFTRYLGAVVDATSPWQSSPAYTDTGLSSSTTYAYTVQARDRSVNQNTNTASSPAAEATTFAEDTTPPPVPSLVTPLGPVTATEITVSANLVVDGEGNGVEYRFHNTSLGSDSGWLADPAWTETGLTPDTTYTYMQVGQPARGVAPANALRHLPRRVAQGFPQGRLLVPEVPLVRLRLCARPCGHVGDEGGILSDRADLLDHEPLDLPRRHRLRSGRRPGRASARGGRRSSGRACPRPSPRAARAIGVVAFYLFPFLIIGELVYPALTSESRRLTRHPTASPMEHQPTSRSHQAARAVDTAPRGGSAWSANPTERQLARRPSNSISDNSVSSPNCKPFMIVHLTG